MRSEKLIVALDVASESDAKALVRTLKKDVSIFKVGLQLYTKAGPTIVKAIQRTDHKVFLDLKFHDIPTTVAKAVMEVTTLGAFMLTLHALGGKDMMERAVDAAHETAEKLSLQRPLLVAVTIPTSQKDTSEIGIGASISDSVVRLARLSQEAGCDGVVCSPREIEAVRQACGPDLLIVTPGIRLGDDEQDDQKRIATPQAAIQAGANYIVVGRPVLRASDPVLAVKKINASLHGIDPNVVKAPEIEEAAEPTTDSEPADAAQEESPPPPSDPVKEPPLG